MCSTNFFHLIFTYAKTKTYLDRLLGLFWNLDFSNIHHFTTKKF
jgi:hypothetical protein